MTPCALYNVITLKRRHILMTISDLNVGDKAGVYSPSSSLYSLSRSVRKMAIVEVIKKTPTGRITVMLGEDKISFNQRGNELGRDKNSYYGKSLVSLKHALEHNAKVQEARDIKNVQYAREKIASEILDHVKHGRVEDMRTSMAALEAAFT